MLGLFSYLTLPVEVSDFEARYLAKLNRRALFFFWAHVPLLTCVAFGFHTGPRLAALLATATLLGPSFAYAMLPSRVTSVVFGFTAMCLGGLLVHFGQGPLQIEMHFYFFVLIALLSVFANPLVVIVAALTVAAHHLVLFLLLPASVFNYQASLWTVFVHALFVVLESIACCFVARTFFDNVIGLERIVERRTAELARGHEAMRFVLDNVAQGIISVDREGVMASERSAIVERWMGTPAASARFDTFLAESDPEAGEWFSVAWQNLRSDALPTALALEQLPQRFSRGERSFSLSYKAIERDGALVAVSIVISDATDEVRRRSAEADQRELMAIFERVIDDRRGFAEFCQESERLVASMAKAERFSAELRRHTHTLKGNCAIFGVDRIVTACHELEDFMANAEWVLAKRKIDRIVRLWDELCAKVSRTLGDRDHDSIEISSDTHRHLLALIDNEVSRAHIHDYVAALRMEPTRERFERIGEQLRALSGRMGKAELDVRVNAGELRCATHLWAPFWHAFGHVVRNTIAHGVESAAERARRGKAARARIDLVATETAERIEISIRDDGPGVAWDKLRERANAMGLPATEKTDLVVAMLTAGVSTQSQVTELSGRGEGLSAVVRVCEDMGGHVEVESSAGEGTRLRFVFPLPLVFGALDPERAEPLSKGEVAA